MKVVHIEGSDDSLQHSDNRIFRLQVFSVETGAWHRPMDNNTLCSDIEKAFLSMPKAEPVKDEPVDLNDVFRVVEAAEKAKHTEHTELYVKFFFSSGEIVISCVHCWDEQMVRKNYELNKGVGTRIEYITRAEYLEWIGKQ